MVQLLDRELGRGADPLAAVKSALARLEGAFALAILFSGRDDILIGARRGSPLAVGYGKGEMFLGSDAMALAPFTDRVTFLDEGDWAVLTRSGAEFYDETGAKVSRPVTRTQASALLIDKGNHRHFMAKEIHEQPEVISRTLSYYVRFSDNTIQLPNVTLPFDRLTKLTISACGTAYYAALTAKYFFERFAKLPVEVDIGSEFRYREAPLPKDGLALFVSQSGETADTLASLRYCKEHGQTIAAVVNVPESTIAREAGAVLPTLAGYGPQQGVDHRVAGDMDRLGWNVFTPQVLGRLLRRRAGGWCGSAHARGPRNRRRLHQGIYVPADRPGVHGHSGRPRPRRTFRHR